MSLMLIGTMAQSRRAVAPPVSYKVWRITVTASLSPDTFKALIAEMVLLNSSGVPLSMAGTATASSTYGAAFEPSAAFDGNPTTAWSSQSDAALPQWLQVSLTTPVAALGLRLTAGDNSARAARMPTAFTLEAAVTDGGTLVSKTSKTGLSAWGIGETRTFTWS